MTVRSNSRSGISDVSILVAEDSPTQAELIRSLLEDRRYRVRLARNGLAALAAARAEPPDLVISDVVMPEMDGYALCRAIRADPALKQTPIILVTTLANPDDIVEGINAGADNFITKPYDEEYLLARIHYLLANRAVRAASKLTTGLQIEIDGRTHLITAEREQILDALMSVYAEASRYAKELQKANASLEQTVTERTAQLQHEIAERRQAEVLLRDAIEHLGGAGIAVFDEDERLVLANSEYRRLRPGVADLLIPGVRFEELTRAAVTRQLHDEEWLTTAVHQFHTGQGEFQQHNSDGSWVLSRSRSMSNGWSASLRIDITEIREAQQRAETLQGQLAQSQKIEAIGNLTGGIAHDFNNMLGVIIGNLGLAKRRVDADPELREMIDEALAAADHGAGLARRLLAFARKQPLRPEQIAINDLVRGTAQLLRRVVPENIDIELDLAAEPVWPVIADPAQLEAALVNLAVNARDAMPNGGRLTISTANRPLDADYAASQVEVTPGDYAMIAVSDTGTGMPAEILERIFEPFFTTKEEGKGTGLGLSMVFGFMKQSSGHINVYSEPGWGTVFRLYLPTAETDAAAVAANGSQIQLLRRVAQETVLLVEDNPALRRTVTRQLVDLGYRVIESEATGALELLEREPIDLLFTDIVMPGELDGVALARLARERRPSLKILLTSGFTQSRLEGTDKAIGTLLTKPYSYEELAAALRAALEE